MERKQVVESLSCTCHPGKKDFSYLVVAQRTPINQASLVGSQRPISEFGRSEKGIAAGRREGGESHGVAWWQAQPQQ